MTALADAEIMTFDPALIDDRPSPEDAVERLGEAMREFGRQAELVSNIISGLIEADTITGDMITDTVISGYAPTSHYWLDALEAVCRADNACPSFPYDGNLRELAEVAPQAAERFRLRHELDEMRRRLWDS